MKKFFSIILGVVMAVNGLVCIFTSSNNKIFNKEYLNAKEIEIKEVDTKRIEAKEIEVKKSEINDGKNSLVNVKIDTQEFSGKNVDVKIDIPTIFGLSNGNKQIKINNKLKNNQIIFKNTVIKNSEPNLNGFRNEGMSKVTIPNNSTVLSLVFNAYEYYGGAHGLETRSTYNIYVPNSGSYQGDGLELQLKDMFLEGTDYRSIINAYIIEGIKKNPGNYFPETLKELPPFKDENFYVNKDGIVIFYQLYEIAPYVFGIPEFTLKYSDMSKYLKNDFLP